MGSRILLFTVAVVVGPPRALRRVAPSQGALANAAVIAVAAVVMVSVAVAMCVTAAVLEDRLWHR